MLMLMLLPALADSLTCTEGHYTTIPPFHVTDGYAMKDRLYENVKDDDMRNVAYIPKRSVVRVDPGDMGKMYSRKNRYVKFKVLSVPSEDNTAYLRNWWGIERGKNRHRMKPGQIGTISNKALIKPNGHDSADGVLKEFDFVVREDAPTFKLLDDGTHIDLANMKIRPVYSKGEGFETRTCCDEEGYCTEEYLFEAFGGAYRDEFVGDFYLPQESCDNEDDLLGHLHVLPKDTTAAIQKLVELTPWVNDIDGLKVHPARDLVHIPTLGKNNSIGPGDSHHYLGDEPRRAGGDSYLHPNVACALTRAIIDWERDECPSNGSATNPRGCQVQFGDGSDVYFDQKYVTRRVEYWPHSKHRSEGYCMDIRPMKQERARSKLTGVTWNGSKADRKYRYSATTTLKFLKHLKKYGLRKAAFNDPKVRKKDASFVYAAGHDDHMHVCFDPNASAVIKACIFGP